MKQRECPVCRQQFIPTHHNQRFCPPPEGKVKSPCAKAYENANRRGTLDQLLARGGVGKPFDCAQCGQRCVPGENVSAHARRFCGRSCVSRWHEHNVEGPARYLALLVRPTDTRRVRAEYMRAMRRDPCAYCGEPSEALDHLVPRCDGGPDAWTNRAGACTRCNSTKQSTPFLTFLAWKQARDAFEPWREIVASIHTRGGGEGPKS